MYVQPRIFCAVAMLSTLTPWHSLRHGPEQGIQEYLLGETKVSTYPAGHSTIHELLNGLYGFGLRS